ncbi:autotransporter domain-containing protein [Burkholderiaceae bacterium DAT-1]|nr:autotransporter domain-containing protein [Burkholderiaceae bacterium DAT-1]
MKRTLSSLLVGTALATLAPVASAYDFSNVYFFGDSLSDVGSFAKVGAPSDYRFTTDFGKLYADWLYGKYKNGAAAKSGIAVPGGTDFAVAGSTANAYAASVWGTEAQKLNLYPTVGQQVDYYLQSSGGRADPNALYTVWIGGNDVQAALNDAALNGNNSYVAQADMGKAAQNTLAQVDALRKAGAQHIMVLNLPNVGVTPGIIYGSLGLVKSGLNTSINGAVNTLVAPQIAASVAASKVQGAPLSAAILSQVGQALGAAGVPAGLAGSLAGNAQLNAAVTSALSNAAVSTTSANAAVSTALNTAFNTSVAQAVAQSLAKNGNYQAGMTAATNAAAQAALTAITGNVVNAAANGLASSYATNAADAVVNVIAASLVPAMAQAGVTLPQPVLDALTAQLKTTLASQLQTQVSATVSASFSAQLGAMLSASLATSFAQAQQGLSSAAGSLVNSVYNPALNAGLNERGNIIEIDINRLFAEVMANPRAFGLDNVAGTACAISVGASSCKSNGATFDASQQYLFVDGVHPTPLVHHVIAQFIDQTLDAPMFAAQLVNAQYAPAQATFAAIDNRSGMRKQGNIDWFASTTRLSNRYAPGNDNVANNSSDVALTIGGEYQMRSHLAAGLVFTASRTRSEIQDPSSISFMTGKFLASNEVIDAYVRHEYGPMTVGADFILGNARYTDIQRTFQLGDLKRTERADTSGIQAGLRVNAQYVMPVGDFNITPNVNLAFRSTRVGNYNEGNVDSTSMRFAKQSVRSLQANVGLKVDTTVGDFKPFASVNVFNEGKDKDRTVTFAQQSASVDGTLPVFTPATHYVTGALGVTGKLTRSVSAYASYTQSFKLKNENREAVSVGLSGTF